MKLDTLANLKVPGLGAIATFPAFGKFWDQLTIWGDLGQVIAQLSKLHIHHVMIKNLTWIQHVAGGAAGHALAKASTLFWCRQSTLHVKSRRHGTQSHR